jgi:hypothetical protein
MGPIVAVKDPVAAMDGLWQRFSSLLTPKSHSNDPRITLFQGLTCPESLASSFVTLTTPEIESAAVAPLVSAPVHPDQVGIDFN